mmetsp:Transcript_21750/g.32380  ORF Transcript_21750/g.32380 Transcript_21750/m.32380 type:complete len:571 (-) Transcript_21750:1292-3004(-)|eukprot:CAMPEP_0194066054 /NCGR_PEP_ID=MMETSP0009_2-20130614/85812_1 /TAXON_ID=210454 /ORGANISM="Grammatophora oceanica, Strain CCMP 410" /LENGTH=570 /DNA_ID=CAMNT_0038718969 /DNA_START=126 /DNA_END=1838 /DNA_ORIENTATION=-
MMHEKMSKSKKRSKVRSGGPSSSTATTSKTTLGSSSGETGMPTIVGAFLVILVVFTVVTLGALAKAPPVDGGGGGSSPRSNNNVGNTADVPSSKKAPISGNNHPNDERQQAIDKLRHTFPVHARDDLEEILHPGILYSINPPPSLDRKMKVPKFWDTSAYGDGGLRNYLGHYGNRLITPEEAANVGSYTGDQETIYVSIASYRDYECGPTIESVFARAIHPERIRVAVISQRDFKTDEDFCAPPNPCYEDPEQAYCKWQANVDIFQVEAQLSVGPVFARHLGHRMYRGEYYAMQVDSHVRFTQGWDDDIIKQWKQAKNEMAVLTTYLSDIQGSIDPKTHANHHRSRPIMCKSDYEGHGKLKHLRHGQQPEGPPGIHGQPTLHPFWAAGFSFARGHFVVQLPYDQYLPMVFQGEEISMGLRGWSYGYDYYTAETSVCFHMYAIKENKAVRKKVPLFWENARQYQGVDVKAMKRLNGIIGMGQEGDEYDTTDQEMYGLGHVRTTEKFFETFGIHTKEQKVEEGLCTFVGKPMMSFFHPWLRKNGMGIDYDSIAFKYHSTWRKDPKPEVTEPF